MTSIREATADDIEFIASVLLLAIPEGERSTDERVVEDFLANARSSAAEQVAGKVPHSTLYVIEYRGERAGRLRVVRPGDQVHLAGIQILPEYRSKGIGRTVIGRILEEGKASGLPVVLEVSKQNPDAERLYVRLGFGRYGENDRDYLMRVMP